MMLPAGARLGPYEVLSPLGAGGMGEVYCARDTRLNRTVALKLLPAELRDRPDRRQRFDLEARAISSLQHPHICALFDVGEQDNTAFFVMEYLEGETLDDRLIRGPLPPKEVLLYAAQIADALDHAHRAHVVHRDLKPSNIMLTSSGAKLLDFGLARNRGVEITGSTPTVTVAPDRLTSEGTILGTFQYMAPEQLEGKDADARTDLFALGTVIYEMATGKKAFEGTSQASLIAAILTGQPPAISATRPEASLPPALDHVVERCLAKNPDDRWQTARDVKMELQWIAGESAQRPRVARAPARRRVSQFVAWAVAAIAIVLAAGSLLTRERPPAPELLQSVVALPAGTTVGIGREFTSLALSPDGRHLAFVAVTDGRQRLWVQSFDEAAPRPLEGTEGGVSPFWSPNSRFIGYYARNAKLLKKIDRSGGPAQVICAADASSLPVWTRDNMILFSQFRTGISWVSAEGGTPTSITQVDKERRELNHYWPSPLPDGRHFLYTATNLGPNGQRATPIVYVASLDPNEPRKEIAREHSRMVYERSGHVLYVQEATLFARSFDVENLRLTGEAVRVAQNVDYYRSTGLAGFAVSDAGVIAHHGGAGPLELVWFDRAGTRLGTLGTPQQVGSVRISPDGESVMVEVLDPKLGTSDLYKYDLARGTSGKFTFDLNDEGSPVWSPDGLTILFRSDRGTGADASMDFFTKRLDGTAELPIFSKPGPQTNEDWSRTGLIAYGDPRGNGRDIFMLSPAENNRTWPFVDSPGDQAEPRFSPTAPWVAYASDETGSFQVKLKPLGEGQPMQTVSSTGGISPRWRRDGKELYYLSGDGNSVIRVSIESASALRIGAPSKLFDIGGSTSFRTIGGNRVYDVTPDGQKFLISVTTGDTASSRITVMRNWAAALGR
jgi:eukaryotic-like serine/threonine-protein kinase